MTNEQFQYLMAQLKSMHEEQCSYLREIAKGIDALQDLLVENAFSGVEVGPPPKETKSA